MPLAAQGAYGLGEMAEFVSIDMPEPPTVVRGLTAEPILLPIVAPTQRVRGEMKQELSFGPYLRALQRWWWLLVACTFVAGATSYVSTLQMPRIYQATTTIIVGQSLQKANPSGQDIYISQQLAQTYAQMVKRRPILQGAAQALGLPFAPAPEDVTARQVAGTQLLEISVRDTEPERARSLADEIARQLILQSPTEAPEESQRRAFVAEQLEDLEKNIEATKQEIASEQQKLDAANSARAIQQYQANITALQQKLASYQSTYASLLLTVQGGTNYISIIEPARLPTKPVSPKVFETVLLASALGLAIALLGVLVIEALNDTVQDAQEAAEITGLPLLGAVARMEGEGYTNKLITLLHPRSSISEAFRVLRTNLQFSSVDKPLRTIMVSSPGPSEGKSVTVANLGVVFAEAGVRTIIVDSDLRRPVQHHIFNLANEHGLADLALDHNASLENYLQPTAVEGLWLLTAGSLPPNPSEILSSQRFREILDQLKEKADLLILDTPPALVVADASIVASRVDGVLVVADSGQTRRGAAWQTVEELQRSRANLLGLVMNRVRSRRSGYYYYYQYSYYYAEDGTRRRRRVRRKRREAQAEHK